MALSLLAACDRSLSIFTEIPVLGSVAITAVSTLLAFWPPLPDDFANSS